MPWKKETDPSYLHHVMEIDSQLSDSTCVPTNETDKKRINCYNQLLLEGEFKDFPGPISSLTFHMLTSSSAKNIDLNKLRQINLASA